MISPTRAPLWLPPEYADLQGGPPSLVLVHIEIGPVSPQGKPLAPPYRQWSRSWVKQIAQLANSHLRSAVVSSVTDTSGVGQSTSTTSPWNVIQVAGTITSGIVVGTGTTAEDRDNYALATLIAEGTGAGQLNYQASLGYVVSAITGGYRDTYDRQVNNNSGSSITIYEMGLIAIHNGVYFLLLRDVLGTPYAVANGAAAVVRYKIDWLV